MALNVLIADDSETINKQVPFSDKSEKGFPFCLWLCVSWVCSVSALLHSSMSRFMAGANAWFPQGYFSDTRPS